MTGFIYAIECSSRIKIGFSEDPLRRLNKVASDAPFPCVLLGYWEGSRADELDVQTKFNAIRLHGEWFAATVELLGFVSSMSTMPATRPKVAAPVDQDDLDNWPAIIARILYRNRWRQSDLAKSVGVDSSNVSRWQAGAISPRADKRAAIRAILKAAEAAE